MNFLEHAKAYENEIIKDLSDLISIASLLDETTKTEKAPFGRKVREALDWLLTKADSEGFKTTDVDGYAGVVSYGEGKKAISSLGHLDVVPADGEWFKTPFEPFIKEGYLVGRGSKDDKGPTIAAFYALKILKDLNIQLDKRIDLIVGCDEETHMRCMEYFKEHYPLPLMGIVPDADFPCVYGEKGILQFKVILPNNTKIKSMKAGSRSNIVIGQAAALLDESVTIDHQLYEVYLKSQHLSGTINDNNIALIGKAFHASLAHKGINAAIKLLQFIGASTDDESLSDLAYKLSDPFGLNMDIAYDSPYMGPLTMNLGVIDVNEESINLTIDIRYPHELKGNDIINKIQEQLPEAVITEVHDSQPLFSDPQSDLTKACLQAYQKVTGDMHTPALTMGGGTYARVLPNHIAVGGEFPQVTDPKWVGGPHEINEAVHIESLIKAVAIYCEIFVELAK